MDYKTIWEELKSKVEEDLKYYEDGKWCSWGEAVHGALCCEEMLKNMKALEEKYSI